MGTLGAPPNPRHVAASPSGWKVSSRQSWTWPSVAASRQGRVGWKERDCTTPRPTARLSASEPCGDARTWRGGSLGTPKAWVCHPPAATPRPLTSTRSQK